MNAFSNYANELLQHFVTDFGRIYGEEHISHNVHCLLHLSEDVEKYGPLDVFSAFKYENFMQKWKNLLRKSEKPLEQIARRFSERKFMKKKTEVVLEKFRNPHNSGPLLHHEENTKQYGVYETENFVIDITKSGDSCVLLTNGVIAVIYNIILCPEEEYKILGEELQKIRNLYTEPCESSLIGIHVVKIKQGLKQWPVSSILNKMWKIPYKEDLYVVNSLLHF